MITRMLRAWVDGGMRMRRHVWFCLGMATLFSLIAAYALLTKHGAERTALAIGAIAASSVWIVMSAVWRVREDLRALRRDLGLHDDCERPPR